MYDVKEKYGGRDKYRSGHGGTRWEDEMEMEIVSGTSAGSRELAVGTRLDSLRFSANKQCMQFSFALAAAYDCVLCYDCPLQTLGCILVQQDL